MIAPNSLAPPRDGNELIYHTASAILTLHLFKGSLLSVRLRPSNEITNAPSKLARCFFGDGG